MSLSEPDDVGDGLVENRVSTRPRDAGSSALMIQPEDMGAAISRVRDFMDVQRGGSEEAVAMHLQAAGIAPEALFRLITS